MNREELKKKKILEQQLKVTNEKVHILDEMDVKLYEMRRLAEYALENALSSKESKGLNAELYVLQTELTILERQLSTVYQ